MLMRFFKKNIMGILMIAFLWGVSIVIAIFPQTLNNPNIYFGGKDYFTAATLSFILAGVLSFLMYKKYNNIKNMVSAKKIRPSRNMRRRK